MRFQQRLDYKLYSLGWRSGLHRHLSKTHHLLLSIFYLYRRGFSAGSQWVEEYYPQTKTNEKFDRTIDTF
jgi:hypothetical protein